MARQAFTQARRRPQDLSGLLGRRGPSRAAFLARGLGGGDLSGVRMAPRAPREAGFDASTGFGLTDRPWR